MGSETELSPTELRKSEERVLKQKERALIKQFSDDKTGYFIIKSTGDPNLDITDECITLEKLVGMGGQFFAFQCQIDWHKADTVYNVFMYNIASQEMARKDALEEKLGKTPWHHFEKIDVTDDLDAKLYLTYVEPKQGEPEPKPNLILPLTYRISGIRRSGINNYLQRAIEAINSNDGKFVDYLKRRGILKGNKFDKETIKKSVRAYFNRRKISKNGGKYGKFVVRVSQKPDDRSPRNKREQNFTGLPHEKLANTAAYGQTVNKRTFYIVELYPSPIFYLEMPIKLSVKQKLKLGYDVSRVLVLLKKLHAVGRDTKPENIMTDGENNKLLDLGLANYHLKEVDASTLAAVTFVTAAGKGCFGTPGYMSPEQAKPKEIMEDGQRKHVFDIDSRADIYGLGGTLYNLFTGERPNVGDNLHAIILYLRDGVKPEAPGKEKLKEIQKAYLKNLGWKGSFLNRLFHTTKYYDLATRYAENVVLMLGACLDHDREKRYQAPEEMQQAIKALMEFKEPEKVTDNLGGAFNNPSRRHKHYFRKVGRTLEIAGLAVAGITSLAPDLVVRCLPEQVDKYMHLVNDLVQKVF